MVLYTSSTLWELATMTPNKKEVLKRNTLRKKEMVTVKEVPLVETARCCWWPSPSHCVSGRYRSIEKPFLFAVTAICEKIREWHIRTHTHWLFPKPLYFFILFFVQKGDLIFRSFSCTNCLLIGAAWQAKVSPLLPRAHAVCLSVLSRVTTFLRSSR